MRRVLNRFGKLGSRHAFQVQRFARDCVLLFDDRSGELMSEVGALVGNLLVLTSQCATGFDPVRATLFTSRQPARGAFDLAFGFPEESRVFNHTAFGVGGETIKPTSMPTAVSVSIAGLGRSCRLNSTTNEKCHLPVASRLNVALFRGRSTA